MEDISGKFRKWLLEKDKWGLPKRRADMCSDTLEIGFLYGYTIAQKEMQEKLDAAIEVIKIFQQDDYDERVKAYERSKDFLKARGE